MANPSNLKSSLVLLAPGFRIQFQPTEEQLFSYYLRNKNNHPLACASATDYSLFGYDVIKEIDFYSFEPSDLPLIASIPFAQAGSKKRSYFFVAKEASEREKRKTKGGFWKSEGWASDVVGEEELVLGTRETFVFYVGDSSCARLTDWVMYEYTPVRPHEGSFVLCCVFLKFQRENRNSEHLLSSYAVKSNASMRDVSSIQHDGVSTFGIGEAEMHDGKSVDADITITSSSIKLISDPNDQIVCGPTESFQLPVAISNPHVLVTLSDGIISGSSDSGDAGADDLMIDSFILEEDFLELDDLTSPLSDIDSS
ncbi:hypothetical protein HHK36_030949 [Tetracentron sinense]|uniref:NAC domain-containing protein n=1 Tax=Tetracentron sinense TaxID=13715 RepID=A0A834YCL7_TETSI|nr:hypothetical protein HHK36_030949 [Tetracentron sinense]